MPTRHLVIACVFAMPLASAMTRGGVVEDDAPKSIRVYDIRDLVVQPPDFAEAPDLVSDPDDGGTSVPDFPTTFDEQEAELSQGEMITNIMDLIREKVDPDGWRQAGGLISEMSELNGTLVVSATEPRHAEIEMLLSDLRATRLDQITLEALVLRVDFAALNRINREMAGGDLLLEADAADKLWDMAAESEGDVALMAIARTVCFNGQRVYVSSVCRRSAPEAGELAADADGPHEPADPAGPTGPADEGVVADTESILTADRRAVIVTVRASAALLGPDGSVEGLKWRTTTRIPAGGCVLLTGAGPTPPGAPNERAKVEYVLALRATPSPPTDKK